MRVLVVYAHPLETSFNAALHGRVLASLRSRGHDVDDCDLYDGSCRAGLRNIDKLGAVCTYGCNRLTTMLMGDPPRRVVTRLLRAMTGRAIRCDYLAHYDMNHTTPERRAGFQEKVTRVFENW
jgi:putative NADPH-quinone reductase